MTIALAINVGDSLVLASDSATAQQLVLPDGHAETINVWNSANKIFNLRKGLPVGAMTWGQASIDGLAIATLSKDLRARLTGDDPEYADWALDPQKYRIEDVAHSVRRFFYDDQPDPKPEGVLGFLVGGYSPGSPLAEWYTIHIDAKGCEGPTEVLPPGEAGTVSFGQPEAVSRLVSGVSGHLGRALIKLGLERKLAAQYVEAIIDQVQAPWVFAGMPVGEVIELAHFLVDATIKFVRFTPGDALVGGPIEIAALTRHEGFKWVRRKHYYDPRLNP
ncbi:MAG: hypothetical protein JWO79_2250 [Actinomycetia bacterium]|nr:hypothetical protein [Actinomycetes bacterium]